MAARDNLTADTSAALYLRRSSRADLGGNRSLREQEAECRSLAERLGLSVVEVYEEREGTGASARSRKHRPEWERALADLDDGARFRTLIVWALDRADRRGADTLGALLTKHAATGRRILGVDGTDTSDERQRLATIIRGEIAREEAENIARRVARTKKNRRAEGRWLGGRPPYGLRVVDGKVEPDPETAPVARRIADEALAGRSLAQIVRGLNADGVPTPGKAAHWQASTVSALLRAPAFAGLQSIRSTRTASGGWPAVAEVYLDEETRRPVSVGTGIITRSERSRILSMLDARSTEIQRGVRKGRRVITTLLGELLYCAQCGRRAARAGGRSFPVYRCGSLSSGEPCGAPFSAPMGNLDDYVTGRYLSRLATLEPGDPLLIEVAARWVARVDPAAVSDRAEAEEAIEAIKADLARARRLAVSGVLTEDEAAEEIGRLRRLRRRAEEALAALPAPNVDVGPLLDLAASREAWELLPVEERRPLLGLAIREIRAVQAGRRGVRFDPEARVTIEWHDEVPPGEHRA